MVTRIPHAAGHAAYLRHLIQRCSPSQLQHERRGLASAHSNGLSHHFHILETTRSATMSIPTASTSAAGDGSESPPKLVPSDPGSRLMVCRFVMDLVYGRAGERMPFTGVHVDELINN